MRVNVIQPKCLDEDKDQLQLFKEDLENFCCKNCDENLKFMVSDPVLCRKCQNMYCADCIIKDNKKICPNCKDDSLQGRNLIAKIDQFIQRHLDSLRFKCSNHEHCKRDSMSYSEAQTHLTQCLYELYYCPFNCHDK